MATKKSPMDCSTLKQVCAQKEDNTNTRDYWISADNTHVTIAKQRNRQKCTEMVKVTKKQFDRLIKWYTTKQ